LVAVIAPKTRADGSGEGAPPHPRIKIIIQIITIYVYNILK